MKLVYLIGEPGVGKTTLMREVVKRCGSPAVESDKPIPHITYPRNVIQLGRERVDFGGTDALSMSIQPQALVFLRTKPAALVFAEGDRLGNRKFFMEVGRFADLRVVLLQGGVYARQRREARNHALGQAQSERWLASRRTKLINLSDMVNLRIDAGMPLEHQVDEMWNEAYR